MMDAAGTLACGGHVWIDPQVKFVCSSGFRADLVDVHIASVHRVSADIWQVQQLTEDTVGRFEGWHIEEQRTQAADLVSGGNGALFPDGGSRFVVDDEAQALAFGILKIQHRLSVAFGDGISRAQSIVPPFERGGAADAQTGSRHAACPAAFRCRGPIEKSQICPRRAGAVGVEQVVGREVILVDGFFNQAQAEVTGVEIMVVACVRGDRGDVMEAVEFHESRSSPRIRTATPSAEQV